MSPDTRRAGSMLEERVAENYRQQGFEVVVEPQAKQLPFDLSGYRPDLIVTKPTGENYLIEIKDSATQMPIERYRDIAETVAQHPGWSFLLVTGDDVATDEAVKNSKDLLTWVQIMQRQAQAEKLLSLDENEAAFLLLWGGLEAMLRRHAMRVHIPIEKFPTPSLIKHLYSQGELSLEQFDEIMKLNAARNLFIHGYQTTNLAEPANRLQALVNDLLNLWFYK
jgi:REase_AHJR-like